MKEYNVTIKVRNNLILEAIEAIGEECGPKFAKLIGVQYGSLMELVNLKASPLLKKMVNIQKRLLSFVLI